MMMNAKSKYHLREIAFELGRSQKFPKLMNFILEDISRMDGVRLWNGLGMHSAIKLEKSAISKVQKYIICIFKNGKKSIFALEKSPKIAFLVVLNFFLVQKIDFLPLLRLQKCVLVKIIQCKSS